ncbi:hypothetical protein [Pseudomonas nicosulfuronedens]
MRQLSLPVWTTLVFGLSGFQQTACAFDFQGEYVVPQEVAVGGYGSTERVQDKNILVIENLQPGLIRYYFSSVYTNGHTCRSYGEAVADGTDVYVHRYLENSCVVRLEHAVGSGEGGVRVTDVGDHCRVNVCAANGGFSGGETFPVSSRKPLSKPAIPSW